MLLLRFPVNVLTCIAASLFASVGFSQTITSITVSPTNLVGGTSAIGTIKLSKAVSVPELAVTLASNQSFLVVPNTIYIAGGTKSGTFPISTSAIALTKSATISGTVSGLSKKVTVTVEAPALASVTLQPKNLAGGASSAATVGLTGIAPAGGIIVQLKSSVGTASVPSSVTIPAGESSVSFPIPTLGVAKEVSAAITASAMEATKTAKITINPAVLAGLSLSPATVVGGNSTGLRVYLNGAAPPGGFSVTLFSTNPELANVLGVLSIPAGATTAGTLVTTNSVSSDRSTLIAADGPGGGVSKTLNILACKITSVTLNPSSVVGGNPTTGTVTLSVAAPSAGVVVAISSSSGSAVAPATVVVPGGALAATFSIGTVAVTTNTSATLSGSLGTSSQSANLTITAATALANSAWPKFHGNSQNTALGLGHGATGSLVWSFQTTNIIGASSPSIGSDGTIYVGSWDSNVYAINNNGTLQWSFPTNNYVFSTPTIAANGTIYVSSTDGYLYALNPNGSLAWKFQSGGFGNSSPALAPDGTIYIGAYNNYFYAINPNGKLKWSFYVGNQCDSTPAIGPDGTIYVGCNDGILYALNPAGTLKWANLTGNVITGSPAIGPDGTIYVGSQDQKLYAIDPSGGFKWAFQTQGQIWSSPAIGPFGTIYVGSTDHNLYAVNPDGSLKWQYTTGDQVLNSSPSVGADGTIYVGSRDGNVYAITKSGALAWKYPTNNWIDSSPSIAADGTIYVGSNTGYIYAIH
jgi:outer membrane protein assembly factor BamB